MCGSLCIYVCVNASAQGTGVKGGCEPPGMGAGDWIWGPLQELQELFTSEPSFWSLNLIYWDSMTHWDLGLWNWARLLGRGVGGCIVCVDCSETTKRLQPWFGELAGVEWSKEFPLATSEGDRRTHRGERGGAKGLCGPIDLGSGEGQDRVLMAQWISRV